MVQVAQERVDGLRGLLLAVLPAVRRFPLVVLEQLVQLEDYLSTLLFWPLPSLFSSVVLPLLLQPPDASRVDTRYVVLRVPIVPVRAPQFLVLVLVA